MFSLPQCSLLSLDTLGYAQCFTSLAYGSTSSHGNTGCPFIHEYSANSLLSLDTLGYAQCFTSPACGSSHRNTGCPFIHECSANSQCKRIQYSCLNSTAPAYMTKLLKVYKPTRQLRSSSDTSIVCLPSVRTLHRLSGTVSLAKLGHRTHSPPLNYLLRSYKFNIPYWLCVCVCVCVCVCGWVGGWVFVGVGVCWCVCVCTRASSRKFIFDCILFFAL